MGLTGHIQLGRIHIHHASGQQNCQSSYVGPSGSMCSLSGVGKRCIFGREGCFGVEKGEDSEGLDVERKSLVCVRGFGTCEVGV